MADSVSRKLELVLCDVLGTTITALPFLPSKGAAGASAAIKPPYAVVAFADGGEQPFAGEDTFILGGTLTVVTHLGDTRGPEHDALLNTIRGALGRVRRGFYPARGLALSGLDSKPPSQVTDSERRSHGDVMELEANCTGIGQSVSQLLE